MGVRCARWVVAATLFLVGACGDGAEDAGWWRPGAEATWQWQLQGAVNTGYDVDVYDVDLLETSPAVLDGLPPTAPATSGGGPELRAGAVAHGWDLGDVPRRRQPTGGGDRTPPRRVPERTVAGRPPRRRSGPGGGPARAGAGTEL